MKGFDYAQPGGYFVTIVTYQRDRLFGEIVNKVAIRRGEACLAPSTRCKTTFNWHHCEIIQIRRHPTYWTRTQRHRHLAKEL